MKGINSVITKPAEAPVKEKKRKAAAAKENAPPREKKPRKAKGSSEPKSPKDPNAPKRPASSYFLFMADFRVLYKKSNPDAKPTEVTKAGGEKWKSMSDEDKAPYNAKHAELKADYPKKVAEYEQKTGTEGSGETKSEISDDADSTMDG